MVRVVLPFSSISHNGYYRIMRNRFVISKRGREFRERVHSELALSTVLKLTGKVKLSIRFSFKDNRKRDLDNLTKSIIDAVKGILFEDDSEIYELNTSKVLGDKDETIIDVSSV